MSSYHITVRLKDFTIDRIQRTFIADDQISFFTLHHAICQTLGFDGYHLRDFEKRQHDSIVFKITCPQEDEEYNKDIRGWALPVDQTSLPTTYQSTQTTLGQIFDHHPKLLYCYDYGDNRQFDVTAIPSTESIKQNTIVCIQSSGGQLIEDCGGTVGLTDRVELYKQNKRDKESFDSKKEFVDALQPYLTPYHITTLKSSKTYLKQIQKIVDGDRGLL